MRFAAKSESVRESNACSTNSKRKHLHPQLDDDGPDPWVTGSHLLDNKLYDFENFEPMLKQIPAGHGSVEKELDDIFDHSEAAFAVQKPRHPNGGCHPVRTGSSSDRLPGRLTRSRVRESRERTRIYLQACI